MNLEYCPRCGIILGNHIAAKTSGICPCGHKMFEINPKWNITEEKCEEILWDSVKYGEKTREEARAAWKEYCQPFIDEFVKKHPDFDQWSYEHQDEIIKEDTRRRAEKLRKGLEEDRKANKNLSYAKSSPTVKCPYCNSTNTKKISSVSRVFSGGFFGLGSSKLGKQWHCNSCGSDF